MVLSRQELLEIDKTAQRAADAARSAILPFFRRSDLDARSKSTTDFDPVTEADRAAELAMREILARHRPDDAILGEEFGRKAGTSGVTWVLDPIDGTRGFISGTPTWGVLIAAAHETGPFYGIIDQPYIGERFTGSALGAYMSGPQGQKDLSTRQTATLSDAVVFTTFPEVGTPEEGTAFHAVASQARLTRYGMDCYAYALVAAGQVDLVIEAGLAAYDIQASIAVIEAAGGVVTNWQGEPVHEGGRAIAAANKKIHSEALQVLQDSLG